MSFLTEMNSLIDKVKHDLDSSETRIINNMEWSERIEKGECYVRAKFNALLMMMIIKKLIIITINFILGALCSSISY